MRKTTISLAIFFSASAAAVSTGCGKRGDPLPPLRPFPAAADAFAASQVGDRIVLEWRAPVRNSDETTEKLELAQAEIRRRLIDIDQLVEDQTRTIEPRKETEELEPETSDASGEPEDVETPPEPVEESVMPAEPDVMDVAPEAEEEIQEAPDELSNVTTTATPTSPAAPAVPQLVIPPFGPPSREVATLPSTEPGARMTFEEEIDPEWIGKRVEYAVVYINRSNRRGPRSSTVQIEPTVPLAAPNEPTATAADGFVSVRWSAPPESATDVAEPSEPESAEAADSEELPPEGPFFSVFRRVVSAKEYPRQPLNPVPTTETEFQDRSVPFNTESCYIVKTVTAPPPPPSSTEPTDVDPLDAAAPGAAERETTESREPGPSTEPAEPAEPAGNAEPSDDVEPAEPVDPDAPVILVPIVPPITGAVRVESEPSPEVCLVPIDTFAPPSPTGLVAVASGEDVLLTWNEVEREDVTGYRVYRAESDSGPYSPLTDELLRVPSYTDDGVVAGATYYYAVTAVDDAPEPNESEKSAVSRVTFAPR